LDGAGEDGEDVAETEAGAAGDAGFGDALAADVGAVGGVEVAEDHAVVADFDGGVLFGDSGVGDDDVAGLVAADDGDAGFEVAVGGAGAEDDPEFGVFDEEAGFINGGLDERAFVFALGGFEEDLEVGQGDGAFGARFVGFDLGFGVAEVDEGDGGFEAGSCSESGVDDLAVHDVESAGGHDVDDADFGGFAGEAESLDLVGDAEELAESDSFAFRGATGGDDGSRIVHVPNKKDIGRGSRRVGAAWCKGLWFAWLSVGRNAGDFHDLVSSRLQTSWRFE